MKAVIYARVSSIGDRQSTERQVLDLKDYANKNGMEVQAVFEEHKSGASKVREILEECKTYCIENGTEILLLSEISRLGRSVDIVLKNILWCKENNLNVYFQKEGFSIYDDSGKENPFLAIMVSCLSFCAQCERENIYFRLHSGRKVWVDKNLKETGKSGLGRKLGSVKTREKKEEEYREALKLLRGGYPVRKVAKLCEIGVATVMRLKKEFGL